MSNNNNNSAPPPSCLSMQEDCLLKTSLAFVVLRNRIKNSKDESSSSVVSPPPPLSLVDLNTTTPTLTADENHLERMFQVAVSTARVSYRQYDGVVLYQSHDLQNSSLSGLVVHLASQFRLASRSNSEWLKDLVKNSLLRCFHSRETILATCTVWNGILTRDCCMGFILTVAIGTLLQALNQNQFDGILADKTLQDQQKNTTDISIDTYLANVLAVNLIHLLESMTIARLKSGVQSHVILNELQHALGDSLCLPVPIHDLAYFYHHASKMKTKQLLTPGAKLMMRQCLWDLIQKVSNTKN